jgi:serine/threonine-protein kinase
MKPSNCFVINKDGEADFVKLVDFGISKVRSDDASAHQANLTRTNSALGTPLYMSPEQARSPRDVDHRADLYSVGAILYELLTGRTPYTAESGEYTEILFKIFTTDPEPLRSLRPEIDEGLAALVHHALSRDPNHRFSSASEMAEALSMFADDRSAQVIARVRGGRGRSLMPPSQSFTPPSPGGPAPGARAHTYPTAGDALRAPRVPTDVGVTRETPPQVGQPPSKTSRAPLVLAFVAVVLLCAGGGFLVVHGRTPATPAATREPPETAMPVVPPPPSLLPTTTTPSASLQPLPSATLLTPPGTVPSASASIPNSGAGTPNNVAGAPSTKPRVPVNLNGVQPHF